MLFISLYTSITLLYISQKIDYLYSTLAKQNVNDSYKTPIILPDSIWDIGFSKRLERSEYVSEGKLVDSNVFIYSL